MDFHTLLTRIQHDGITVSWAPLHSAGCYEHATRTIWLDTRLDSYPRQALSVLAHEYAHALAGDDGPQPASIERLRDHQAARMLITPEEYKRAETLVGAIPFQLAIELGVTVRLIRAWPD